MLSLTVENLMKTFHGHGGKTVNALDEVSFTLEPGEIFTLLGPSGCGKTTTLRSVAGLEKPNGGVISIGERQVFNAMNNVFIPPNERHIGMVFQSYAIWPHMNVFDNVAFPLKHIKPKIDKKEMKTRVIKALETVQLGGYENRSATQLSGGQQQRLALARSIVSEPKILLLDEPLSNLDAKLRELMRFELKRLQRELGITTLYVTHDQAEALALSNRIAVMKDGKVVQIGTPNDIYKRPHNRFVADFIGSTNFIEGIAEHAVEGGMSVKTKQGSLRCSCYEVSPLGSSVLISIRPETIEMLEEATDDAENLMKGIVTNRVFLGEIIDYLVRVDDSYEIRVKTNKDFQIDQPVSLSMKMDQCLIVPYRDIHP